MVAYAQPFLLYGVEWSVMDYLTWYVYMLSLENVCV